jgi:hypothetical protein
MKPLKQRIEQAGGICAATCARDGSQQNNFTVISDLKAAIYALTLELRNIAETLRDGEEIDTDTLAEYAALPCVYEFRAGLKSRAVVEEVA